MSTNEILWVNRNVAMFARLHHLRTCRATWASEGRRLYRLTLECEGQVTTVLLNVEALRQAFEGDLNYQGLLLSALRNLVRSLDPARVAPNPLVH